MKHHRNSNNSLVKQAKNGLFDALAQIKTADEAELFLKDLCTPNEIQAMADRWLVVLSIKAEKPYRQIYDETGVSVTTVGRVARCVALGEGGYNLIYDRLDKKSKKTNGRK